MSSDSQSLHKLLQCSKQEFLAKGFKNASLRSIATAAGLTTGAIYGYFKNKDAIFNALVSPVCKKTAALFDEISKNYFLPDGGIKQINLKKSLDNLLNIYGFIYDNFDEFRLLLCCAEGSSNSDFVHTIVEYEVAYTKKYLEAIGQSHNAASFVDDTAIHMLCECYVNSMLEPVRHNITYDKAIKNIEFLCLFFTGGWETIINFLLNGG